MRVREKMMKKEAEGELSWRVKLEEQSPLPSPTSHCEKEREGESKRVAGAPSMSDDG